MKALPIGAKLFLTNEERVMGIEPTPPAWKAGALPLSYTRIVATTSRHHIQWREQDSNLRRQCHQIYSLAPLATRVSRQVVARAQCELSPTIPTIQLRNYLPQKS